MKQVLGYIRVPCGWDNPHTGEHCMLESQSNTPLPQRCEYCRHNENYYDEKDVIYLGLFGVYPPEHNEEHHSIRGSEGTLKISELIDKFVIDLLTLQEEYSDEGATDTSARENIFQKLEDRYHDKRMGGF